MADDNKELLKNISSLISSEIPDKHSKANSRLILNLEDIGKILTVLYTSQDESVIKLANSIVALIKESDDNVNILVLEIKCI